MKIRKIDDFKLLNEPETIASSNQYTSESTMDYSLEKDRNYIKHEIDHVKEIFNSKITNIENKISELKQDLSNTENRIWAISGVIITIIITIIVSVFIYILPDLYKNDYIEKYKEIKDNILKLETKVNRMSLGTQIQTDVNKK